MFRAVFAGFRSFGPVLQRSNLTVGNFLSDKLPLPKTATYSTFISQSLFSRNTPSSKSVILPSSKWLICQSNLPIVQPSFRSLTKFSLRKGKRKSVKAVLKRFFRLDWGIWIRTRAGRKKHLWKKSEPRKRRLRQHVFCNATQSTLLDKMVTSFWKKRRYYIDDPYEPYHKREEFPITRKRPI